MKVMFYSNWGKVMPKALLFTLFFAAPFFLSAQTESYCLTVDGVSAGCGITQSECSAIVSAVLSDTTSNTSASCTIDINPPQAIQDQFLPPQPPSIFSAQQDSLADTVDISIINEYPNPGETVSVNISSNVASLDRSEISWYVNGSLTAKGLGETKFEFIAGRVGSEIELDIVIKTSDGFRIDRQVITRPAELTLVWEALSYTPPFYRGKALLSPESTIKVVAFPFFRSTSGELAAETLIYTWRVNKKIVLSGIGKNVLETKGPKPYGALEVSVEVSSQGGSITKTANLNLNVSSPEVVFYEEHPLEGVRYNTALFGAFNLSGDEATVRAEPYFFTDQSAVFSWRLNNRDIQESTGNSITLRNDDGSLGTSAIGVSVRSILSIFQRAENILSINFGF